MKTNAREHAVLIADICRRLGGWGESKVYQPFSGSTMVAIREDAERLVELLDARELNLYREVMPLLPSGDEGG